MPLSTAPAARDIAVIGAGPMGLAAAFALCKAGHRVTVFEAGDRLGGMSAHADFAGTRIERYYHFVCGPDEPLFAMLREFGLEHRLRWTDTKMGFYFRGTLYEWGSPAALLRFPGLGFVQKLRYGLHLMWAKRITDWRPYDRISASEWLERWIGKPAYDVMWRSLFHYKFYEKKDLLSAAWLGTRIKRVALSRKSLSQESLGYIEGGSETLLTALGERIRAQGGAIELNAPVEKVLVVGASDGGSAAAAPKRVAGVRVRGEDRRFDTVVSTVPLPYVNRMIPELPADERARIAAIDNVAVVCVLLKLKRPFTANFWTNINDDRIEIPGLIEYTNLNPLDGSTILYAPYYMPQAHPKYGRGNDAFVAETLGYLQLIRPDFDRSDVVASMASRYEYAQTVCTTGFFDALPSMRSGVQGLFLADTSHYYPEDRSISESVRIGQQLAELACAPGE